MPRDQREKLEDADWQKQILDLLEKFFRIDYKIFYRRRESKMGITFFKTEPKNPKMNELRPVEMKDLVFLANQIHACCINPTNINIDEKVWVIVDVTGSIADKEERKYKIRYEPVSEIILNKDGTFLKTAYSGNAIWEYEKTAFPNRTIALQMAALYELTGEKVPHINYFRNSKKKGGKAYEFDERWHC